LLALNILQSQIYSIQLLYLQKTYAGNVFGFLMSLSCFVQSAIMPTSRLWNDSQRRSGAVFFACSGVLFCGVWALEQVRQVRLGRPADVTLDPPSSEESEFSFTVCRAGVGALSV